MPLQLPPRLLFTCSRPGPWPGLGQWRWLHQQAAGSRGGGWRWPQQEHSARSPCHMQRPAHRWRSGWRWQWLPRSPLLPPPWCWPGRQPAAEGQAASVCWALQSGRRQLNSSHLRERLLHRLAAGAGGVGGVGVGAAGICQRLCIGLGCSSREARSKVLQAGFTQRSAVAEWPRWLGLQCT